MAKTANKSTRSNGNATGKEGSAMSEDVDWAELSDEENAAMEALVKEAERTLTPEERRAVAQEALFPVECTGSPYAQALVENNIADGAVTINWRVYRTALQRRLSAKRRAEP